VLNIFTGIIKVQRLSPLIHIKEFTRFDTKARYPSFLSFFHSIYFFWGHKYADLISSIHRSTKVTADRPSLPILDSHGCSNL